MKILAIEYLSELREKRDHPISGVVKHFVTTQLSHIQPAFLRPDIGDIRHTDLIRRRRGKLPTHRILEHRLLVIAVRRHLVFRSVLGLDASLSHQGASLAASDRKTQDIERPLHPPRPITVTAGIGARIPERLQYQGSQQKNSLCRRFLWC